MRIRRRTLFKVGAAATAFAVTGRSRDTSAGTYRLAETSPAVLVDTTRCVGCRACEAACAEQNGLAGPAGAGDRATLDTRRTTDERTYTVVNRVSRDPVRYAKTQCMHCVDPGCAAACPAKALEKTPAGPVVYHTNRCLGCRYCMIACPFDVPKFEYGSPAPYVKKCSFCAERQAKGDPPACVSVCPSGALTFGTRAELLHEARARLYGGCGHYVPHIYGEHEAGGTSWLYISDLPLERIGLPDNLLTTSYPELTWTFLSAVPFVLMLWPPLLMGIHQFSEQRHAQPHEALPESQQETPHE